jgi:cytochrome c oxidase subunit 2
MDRYEIKALRIIGIVLFVFVMGILLSLRKTNTPECIPYGDVYNTPAVKQIDSTVFQVYYVAKMWSFEPAEVKLPVGSEVDLYLTSGDVVHGFHIWEKNINMMAVYGSVNKTTLTFDKPGVYKITCHEYCGAQHQMMQGEIIVN